MIIGTQSRKLRKEASHLLHQAQKVIHYRGDILSKDAVHAIEHEARELDHLVGKKKTLERDTIHAQMEKLDALLRKHGGRIYPVTFLSENVEMLVVAAILAIGIRTFFIQPFKIPTNSMYPTYAGMLPIVYTEENPEPNPLERAWLFATEFASHYEVEAPARGSLELEVRWDRGASGPSAIAYTPVQSRKLLVLPAVKFRYQLFIGGQQTHLDVPQDFRLDEVVHRAFFPEASSFQEAVIQAAEAGNVRRINDDIVRLEIDRNFAAGDKVLSFDITTGDMLFVDRVSYHFVEPKVGAPIVFRTDEIPGLRIGGQPNESYYIKRLVGKDGDTLRVDPPTLYRNGQPIQGADSFPLEFAREGEYPGYVNAGWMNNAEAVEHIPEGYFFAMGDNSPNSHDSRSWGFPQDSLQARRAFSLKREGDQAGTPINMVPETAVVGKALFIFYPITKRWGPAE